MLLLIVPALLFAGGASILILRVWRPKFRFGWMTAVGVTAVVWLLTWLWQPQLPLSISLPFWRISDFSVASPAFAADGISWLYGGSLVALALASLLTAPARPGFPNASSWAMTMGLTGLGILAVTAANPITLLLLWSAIDLVELGIMLRWTRGERAIGRAIGVFSVRASGSLVLMLAQVVGAAPGAGLDFHSLPLEAQGLLLLAAALHLGVLPFPLPYFSEAALRRGTGTTLRLVSAASGLVLLSRVGAGSLSPIAAVLLLVLCAIAAIYSAWMWLRAPDEIVGRSYWIIALSCFALGAALQGNVVGAAGWGNALLLTGGLIFLASVQQRGLARLSLIGAWTLSALPLSLTASGWNVQPGLPNVALPAFIVAQAIMLAGYMRRILRPSPRDRLESQPAWIRSIYPVGIWILLVSQLLLGLWGWQGALQLGAGIAGVAASLVALGLFWIIPRVPVLNPIPIQSLPRFSAPLVDRIYQALGRAASSLQSVTVTITHTLEGEAGIMWSLVLLILFISLIAKGVR